MLRWHYGLKTWYSDGLRKVRKIDIRSNLQSQFCGILSKLIGNQRRKICCADFANLFELPDQTFPQFFIKKVDPLSKISEICIIVQ